MACRDATREKRRHSCTKCASNDSTYGPRPMFAVLSTVSGVKSSCKSSSKAGVFEVDDCVLASTSVLALHSQVSLLIF
jgi:hypothetical protein